MQPTVSQYDKAFADQSILQTTRLRCENRFHVYFADNHFITRERAYRFICRQSSDGHRGGQAAQHPVLYSERVRDPPESFRARRQQRERAGRPQSVGTRV